MEWQTFHWQHTPTYNTIRRQHMKYTDTTASRNHSASKCYHEISVVRYHLFYMPLISFYALRSLTTLSFSLSLSVHILFLSLHHSAFSRKLCHLQFQCSQLLLLGCDIRTQPKTTAIGIYNKINWNIEQKEHNTKQKSNISCCALVW